MLSIQELTKSYGDTLILDHISLDIQDGEIVSILGPSGSGKTTLLNLILGLVKSDHGGFFTMGRTLLLHLWKNEDSISFFRLIPYFQI